MHCFVDKKKYVVLYFYTYEIYANGGRNFWFQDAGLLGYVSTDDELGIYPNSIEETLNYTKTTQYSSI